LFNSSVETLLSLFSRAVAVDVLATLTPDEPTADPVTVDTFEDALAGGLPPLGADTLLPADPIVRAPALPSPFGETGEVGDAGESADDTPFDGVADAFGDGIDPSIDAPANPSGDDFEEDFACGASFFVLTFNFGFAFAINNA
jgi:hypothetical protein